MKKSRMVKGEGGPRRCPRCGYVPDRPHAAVCPRCREVIPGSPGCSQCGKCRRR